MANTLRLSKKEQEGLRKKCIEFNKLLIAENKVPVKESDLAHILLDISIRYAKINSRGEVIVDV